MKTIKNTLETEAISSNDQQQSLSTKKTWTVKNKHLQSSRCIRTMMAYST
jgi:hypothetical protein